ncbi:hypothetical protein MF672_000870 [Actinomadura sp. ATCC 31491]|uniref:Secreted protein n=1 Tax=Actinomadura luzonensis TaxID=2805427 RepID=A0ABT0FJ86_9ACTN|nr:hypothetical protein [Actinomadura luzonensis]MCK2212357.1 hypothetical protein [Actinomadura luzonensis]
MNLLKKAMMSTSVLGAALCLTSVLGVPAAQAEVWACDATADPGLNMGEAVCYEGFGNYRVRVECNSAHWPYTRNIDGPVVYKSSDQLRGPSSVVWGEPNGCHVVRAWPVAL